MRIINIPEITIPGAVPAPAPSAPALEPERVVALENVAKSVLEKIQDLEERVRQLEQTQRVPVAVQPPEPVVPTKPIALAAVPVDAEAVNKQLMEKMWKYLNNEQLPKAI